MNETEKRILETAKNEFLERGFQGTTMRRIAALSGVTTGALYGYFASKEDIFDSLVKEAYETVMDAYKQAHEEFAALPYDTQVNYLHLKRWKLRPSTVHDNRDCLS